MRRKLSRGGSVALCGGLVAVLAGCTAPASSTVTTPGKALTIYASVPPGGASDQRVQDVLAAEQLALKQLGAQVGGYTISLRVLQGKNISDNARTAIEDPHAIAYLGEVVAGQSADSVGITNALQLPELSPTDTAQALTQSSSAVPGSPKLYYEDYSTYGQTFARLVPTTSKEASALIKEMGVLGVKSLYVAADGDYGNALAAVVRGVAGSISIRSSPSGADAVLAATDRQGTAARILNAAAAGSPAAKLFGPSALDDQSFVSMLSPAAQANLYISAPGFLARQLTSAGQSFVSSFKASYQHDPAPEAIFGYEAMNAVIGAIRQAGASANSRATVLHDLLARDETSSVLGPYRLQGSGDTTLACPFLISRVRAGRLVPFTSIPPG